MSARRHGSSLLTGGFQPAARERFGQRGEFCERAFALDEHRRFDALRCQRSVWTAHPVIDLPAQAGCQPIIARHAQERQEPGFR
jgi:hypothetical protein